MIGIGGSYLGARAVIEALHSSIYDADKSKTHVIYVGNNLSPDYLNDVIQAIEGKNFSINVISKSGTTTEPAIAFRVFREIIENKYGLKEAQKRINVGGRFSVLTPVGLLPIAASGIDIDELMDGAIESEDKYSDSSLEYNKWHRY